MAFLESSTTPKIVRCSYVILESNSLRKSSSPFCDPFLRDQFIKTEIIKKGLLLN